MSECGSECGRREKGRVRTNLVHLAFFTSCGSTLSGFFSRNISSQAFLSSAPVDPPSPPPPRSPARRTSRTSPSLSSLPSRWPPETTLPLCATRTPTSGCRAVPASGVLPRISSTASQPSLTRTKDERLCLAVPGSPGSSHRTRTPTAILVVVVARAAPGRSRPPHPVGLERARSGPSPKNPIFAKIFERKSWENPILGSLTKAHHSW